jgi:hypothetical protein
MSTKSVIMKMFLKQTLANLSVEAGTGHPPVTYAFCNADHCNSHFTHSFRLSGVRGSNYDCTAM